MSMTRAVEIRSQAVLPESIAWVAGGMPLPFAGWLSPAAYGPMAAVGQPPGTAACLQGLCIVHKREAGLPHGAVMAGSWVARRERPPVGPMADPTTGPLISRLMTQPPVGAKWTLTKQWRELSARASG